MKKSIELFENKRVQKIIVSGGFGKEGFWEGTEMRNYLIKNNIPSNKIIVDNKGIDTEATVINSIKIMAVCISLLPFRFHNIFIKRAPKVYLRKMDFKIFNVPVLYILNGEIYMQFFGNFSLIIVRCFKAQFNRNGL